MSVQYFNAVDFGREGGHLAINSPGFTFLMFHSQKCTYCVNFLPDFKQFPGIFKGINFGLCCVDGGNSQIVSSSQKSSTPIKAVPKFILYNDGIPYIEYSGKRNIKAIIDFLQEAIGKLDQKQQFTRQRRPESSMVSSGASSGAKGVFVINPTSKVKEYETSYGLPYNVAKEADFINYEDDYRTTRTKK